LVDQKPFFKLCVGHGINQNQKLRIDLNILLKLETLKRLEKQI